MTVSVTEFFVCDPTWVPQRELVLLSNDARFHLYRVHITDDSNPEVDSVNIGARNK